MGNFYLQDTRVTDQPDSQFYSTSGKDKSQVSSWTLTFYIAILPRLMDADTKMGIKNNHWVLGSPSKNALYVCMCLCMGIFMANIHQEQQYAGGFLNSCLLYSLL